VETAAADGGGWGMGMLERAAKYPTVLLKFLGIGFAGINLAGITYSVLMQSYGQGLTLANFRAQLEFLRNTSLKSELSSSTSGTHPRVIWVTG
jgi:hypothetical protein